MKYDIAIIGAGISGAAVAAALSRYAVRICVLEKGNDVSAGASKANSGIVHAGYDAEPGTLMAKFNAQGAALYPELCRRLDVPFSQCGSYVLAFDEEDLKTLRDLRERGKRNGIPDLHIVGAEELRRREAQVSEAAVAALYAPQAGIVSPYELVVALMENAMDNGAELFLESGVQNIRRRDGGYLIEVEDREIEAACVINCAGAYADRIHNMLLEPAFTIRSRRGEYYLLDKYAAGIVNSVIFQCPGPAGKGVLVAPTTHGNVLAGPNSAPVPDPGDTGTTREGLSEVWAQALKSVPQLPYDQVITTFAGVRAEPSSGDFIIRDYPEAPGFIDVAGIKSPGLTAAPAFAEYVREIVQKYFPGMRRKTQVAETRREHLRFHELPHERKRAAVEKDARYGRIVCRCEGVTEAEILDIIHRNAGARTLDGVKRRARCGGGRCQGGFCGPRLIEILSRELGIPKEQVRKDAAGSELLTGETKGGGA